ncbi:MAG: VWA domain-containing protein [Phycisphaerae bacterium]
MAGTSAAMVAWAGDPSKELMHKWLLAGLVLVPVVWWCWLDPRRRAAVLFSDVSRLRLGAGGARARARLVLPILRSLALAALVVALARPRQGNAQTQISSEGIAIQLVCDISGSMNALDFESSDGEPTTRVDVVKRVVADFVRGNSDLGLHGRPNDLIGLVTFARYADSVCPLTLDHANLLNILKSVRAKNDLDDQRRRISLEREYRQLQLRNAAPAELREVESLYRLLTEEDGTAIGDAIGLGLERLNQATRGQGDEKKPAVKGRVMVLMTDGKQTVPDSLDPVEAAEIAKPLGIRVYTVLVGRSSQVPVQQINRVTGEPELIAANFEIDESVLQEVASATGGKFYRATDTRSLVKIYQEIDKLERTKTDEKRYMEYTEKSGPWLMASFVMLALEMTLANTLLRKIP